MDQKQDNKDTTPKKVAEPGYQESTAASRTDQKAAHGDQQTARTDQKAARGDQQTARGNQQAASSDREAARARKERRKRGEAARRRRQWQVRLRMILLVDLFVSSLANKLLSAIT